MFLRWNLWRTDPAQTVFSAFIGNVTWYKITQPTKTNWLVPTCPLCINIEPINRSEGSLLFHCQVLALWKFRFLTLLLRHIRWPQREHKAVLVIYLEQRQESTSVAPLINKEGYLHTCNDSTKKAEILNQQFHSVYTKEGT